MREDAGSGKDLVIATLESMVEELTAGVEWENQDLAAYLEALGALLGSIENAHIDNGDHIPDDPWNVLSRALLGARWYE